jgi:hypothetical protein
MCDGPNHENIGADFEIGRADNNGEVGNNAIAWVDGNYLVEKRVWENSLVDVLNAVNFQTEGEDVAVNYGIEIVYIRGNLQGIVEVEGIFIKSGRAKTQLRLRTGLKAKAAGKNKYNTQVILQPHELRFYKNKPSVGHVFAEIK